MLQRDMAIGALKAETAMNFPKSFLNEQDMQPLGKAIVGSKLETKIEGAIGATGLGWNGANDLKMFLDLAVLWGFGDFDEGSGCSSYYDRNSPWYNSFYGGYAIRSHKPDGAAWGYDGNGQLNLPEFLEVCAVDYNFLTAGSFGCPPANMCFRAEDPQVHRKDGWDIVDLTAIVPSGLHDPTAPLRNPNIVSTADPNSYLAFGIPHSTFLNGTSNFEEVELKGQFFMRHWATPSKGRPVTFVWGAACHNTTKGEQLLAHMMEEMRKSFHALGG